MVYDNLHITGIAMFQEISSRAPTQIVMIVFPRPN